MQVLCDGDNDVETGIQRKRCVGGYNVGARVAAADMRHTVAYTQIGRERQVPLADRAEPALDFQEATRLA